VTKFHQGGKPDRPVYVTSRKKIKVARKLTNEVGVQRARAVKQAMAKAEAATLSEWMASDRAVLANTGYRCTVYRRRGKEVVMTYVCDHHHKMPQTAIACAQKGARRLNREEQESWGYSKVAELVREVTAKG